MKTFEKTPDEELIVEALQHDTDALGELYNRYYKKTFHECLSLVKDRDEAFDLAQESLLRAFDKLKGFRGECSFSTWLYVICHRHCLEVMRKRNKKAVLHVDDVLDEESIPPVDSISESIDRSEVENIMVSLINKLPEAERELLLLKYSEGESIESLRFQLHISASAVKMRLKRSKEKLNQLYILAMTAGLAEALSQLG
jgi:RNA polymerase sigma-70 factor (ECF subfamily)